MNHHQAISPFHSGHCYEKLQYLTFADETFDIVITQNVMEHAFQPGGAHIITTPKHKSFNQS